MQFSEVLCRQCTLRCSCGPIIVPKARASSKAGAENELGAAKIFCCLPSAPRMSAPVGSFAGDSWLVAA